MASFTAYWRGGPALQHREPLERRPECVAGGGHGEEVARPDDPAVRKLAGEEQARTGVGGLRDLGEAADLREVDPAHQAERAGPGHEHVHRRPGGDEVRVRVLDPPGRGERAHHDPAPDAGEEADDEPGGPTTAQLSSTPRPDRSHEPGRIEGRPGRVGGARHVTTDLECPPAAAGGIEGPRRTITAMAWEGDDYQRRFDALAAEGEDVHGEADFIADLLPHSVLDAGCGTGRVAIELANRGIEAVGVDRDASMLATAQDRDPDITWIQADVTVLDLERTFDVVVMAGNVPLFTPEGTQAALVAGGARHVAPGGVLVLGFQLGRGYELAELDAHAAAAGLELDDRFATWGREPFPGDGSYAVSVFRRIA